MTTSHRSLRTSARRGATKAPPSRRQTSRKSRSNDAPARREPAVDGLRAIAVLAVVAHHAEITPFALGTRGVDLFFVISGFCLALPTLRRGAGAAAPRFDLVRFACARAARIVPPYYVALALFVALSFTPFGLPTAIGPPWPFEWLQDALFITSSAPSYNASFWTVGIETIWYVFFPAMLAVYVRSKPAFASAAVVAYFAHAWRPELVFLGCLPCFMFGIVAADLHVRGLARSRFVPFAALIALAVAAFVDRGSDHGDPLWHLACFAIVLAGVGALEAPLSFRPLAFLGIASYSIYLVHQPLMLFLAYRGWSHDAAAAVAIAAGLLFWKIVEVPALSLSKRLVPKRPSDGAAFA